MKRQTMKAFVGEGRTWSAAPRTDFLKGFRMHQFSSSATLLRLDSLLTRAELDALLHGHFPEGMVSQGVPMDEPSLHACGTPLTVSRLSSGAVPSLAQPRQGMAGLLFGK